MQPRWHSPGASPGRFCIGQAHAATPATLLACACVRASRVVGCDLRRDRLYLKGVVAPLGGVAPKTAGQLCCFLLSCHERLRAGARGAHPEEQRGVGSADCWSAAAAGAPCTAACAGSSAAALTPDLPVAGAAGRRRRRRGSGREVRPQTRSVPSAALCPLRVLPGPASRTRLGQGSLRHGRGGWGLPQACFWGAQETCCQPPHATVLAAPSFRSCGLTRPLTSVAPPPPPQ